MDAVVALEAVSLSPACGSTLARLPARPISVGAMLSKAWGNFKASLISGAL